MRGGVYENVRAKLSTPQSFSMGSQSISYMTAPTTWRIPEILAPSHTGRYYDSTCTVLGYQHKSVEITMCVS